MEKIKIFKSNTTNINEKFSSLEKEYEKFVDKKNIKIIDRKVNVFVKPRKNKESELEEIYILTLFYENI